MVVKVYGGTLLGLDAVEIAVEVTRGSGWGGITFVGLPTAAVRESKERILGALRSCQLPLPEGALLVNLAPADLRKEGVNLDLPIALGVLAHNRAVPADRLGRYLVAGELALSGAVRSVRGSLALGLLARRRSRLSGLILPAGNVAEVRRFIDVPLVGVEDLSSAVRFLVTGDAGAPAAEEHATAPGTDHERDEDLGDVRGQEAAKRALVVAAAGGHSLLMVGPPGTGKTLLARRLPGLLPALAAEQSLEVALVHSVTGRTRFPRPERPPFRAPHHTVSHVGLVGGGNPPRPGEVSLAHHGVLFLDEMPEFRRSALEALRECIEEGAVSVVRSGASVRFPARFQLVAAMNPCPCGFATHPARSCSCSPGEIHRYRRRLSGALLDRIDLEVEVGAVAPEDLEGLGQGLTSERARDAVQRAGRRRGSRGPNAGLGPQDTLVTANPTETALTVLRQAAHKLKLSARGYHRTLRVARTVADLEGEERVGPEAIAEALRYRPRMRLP